MVLSDHWFVFVCEFVLSFNQNRRWSFRITGLFVCASLCCPLTRTGDGPFGSLVCFCVRVCVVLSLEQDMVLSDHWFVFVCEFVLSVNQNRRLSFQTIDLYLCASYSVTLNIFYCSIRNNWIGHKFHNLETSSPIHT